MKASSYAYRYVRAKAKNPCAFCSRVDCEDCPDDPKTKIKIRKIGGKNERKYLKN